MMKNDPIHMFKGLTVICLIVYGCSETTPSPVYIEVSSLGRDFVIKGLTGRPLGVPMSLVGQWHLERFKSPTARLKSPSDKGADWLIFEVQSVDGNVLATPVFFRDECVNWIGYSERKPLREDGDVWKFRAYESMCYVNLPDTMQHEMIAVADFEDFHPQPFLVAYHMDDGTSIGQFEPTPKRAPTREKSMK